jgi:hypothetical protein
MSIFDVHLVCAQNEMCEPELKKEMTEFKSLADLCSIRTGLAKCFV